MCSPCYPASRYLHSFPTRRSSDLAGYMNLEGRGTSNFDANFESSDTHGRTDSDFFTTIRGRLGFAFGHWLFYGTGGDRKSTRLNSSHANISYAVFCLKKKTTPLKQ